MIELVQFPWSPFCLVQRRILEFSKAKFKIVNIPNGDRSLVWRLTRERYYQVPVIKDGRSVIFETGDNSQVVAKYVDEKFQLGLFPGHWRGVQTVLWMHIENEVEGPGFKLNDVYWKETVPPADRLRFLRHKERKFGRGCIDRWASQQAELLENLTNALMPYEQMLVDKTFLLEDRPRFVDFDLWGMLANFLYSGHYEFPARCPNLKAWFQRLSNAKFSDFPSEKLRS